MDEDLDDREAESAWREGFRMRIIAARGARTQETMAELLGIKTNTYGKYEGGRKSVMPVRLLPKFAKICGVDLVELIEGPKKAKPQATQPEPVPIRKKRVR
jgi:transcriptional regulator with XRE-family HTH domain